MRVTESCSACNLPFAVVPLVRFTTDRRLMGELVSTTLDRHPGLGHGRGDHRAEHEAAV